MLFFNIADQAPTVKGKSSNDAWASVGAEYAGSHKVNNFTQTDSASLAISANLYTNLKEDYADE